MADYKKTKAVNERLGEESFDVEMSVAEVAERQAEEATFHEKLVAEAHIVPRVTAYQDHGWETPFDLIEDILDRGMETVQAERVVIKAAHPKR